MKPAAVYRSVGAAIAKRRRDLGFTQAQLADKLQMSRASIANIERGEQSILVHQLLIMVAELKLESVLDLLPDVTGNSSQGFYVIDGPQFDNKQIEQISSVINSVSLSAGGRKKSEPSDAS